MKLPNLRKYALAGSSSFVFKALIDFLLLAQPKRGEVPLSKVGLAIRVSGSGSCRSD